MIHQHYEKLYLSPASDAASWQAVSLFIASRSSGRAGRVSTCFSGERGVIIFFKIKLTSPQKNQRQAAPNRCEFGCVFQNL